MSDSYSSATTISGMSPSTYLIFKYAALASRLPFLNISSTSLIDGRLTPRSAIGFTPGPFSTAALFGVAGIGDCYVNCDTAKLVFYGAVPFLIYGPCLF